MSTSTLFRHIATEQVGDVCVVVTFRDFHRQKITGVSQIQTLRCDLRNVDPNQRILLDFTGICFLSSAALGMLEQFARRVQKCSGTLIICCLEQHIIATLRGVHLIPEVFTYHPDRDAALAALAQ